MYPVTQRHFARWLSLLLIGAILTTAARAFQVAGISEPWTTLLYLVAVPIIVQAVKLFMGRTGKKVADRPLQIISFLLAAAFTYASGGFAGLNLPGLPDFSGDVFAVLVGVVTFLAEVLRLIAAALGSVEIAYRLVLKRIMEGIGFALPARAR